MGRTCGRYSQPFCSYFTACVGAVGLSSPAEMKTTTHCSVFPGPVATFSVITGVVCCLAHEGSLDISIGFIFIGVPVYVTLPVMDPEPAGGVAKTIMALPIATVSPNAATNFIRIYQSLLLIWNYCAPPAESGPIGFRSFP